jgi:hypothetical protein
VKNLRLPCDSNLRPFGLQDGALDNQATRANVDHDIYSGKHK